MSTSLREAASERLLRDLYAARFQRAKAYLDLHEWEVRETLAEGLAARAYHELKQKGLIENHHLGLNAQLTTEGVVFVEEAGIADPALREPQEQYRWAILEHLADIREKEGARGRARIGFVQGVPGLSTQPPLPNNTEPLRRNLSYLRDQGLIEYSGTDKVKITEAGFDEILRHRELRRLRHRFLELLNGDTFTPQQRGHELEKLLQAHAIREGWQAEANVHAPGEEIDLVLHHDPEGYFLVSCKWKKDAIQTDPLSRLRDLVTARPQTRGVLVSMSGFSNGAIQLACRRIESAMILLFGAGDVEAIFNGKTNLTDLLRTKVHAATMRRAILVDGKTHSQKDSTDS